MADSLCVGRHRSRGWRTEGLLRRKSFWSWLQSVVLFGFGVMAMASGETPSSSLGPVRSLLPRGRHVFQQHCVVCHGRYGTGDGEMTPGMIPKPRDLSQGIFKFRSTPSGFLPLTEDLRRTIRQGLSGSSMPSFTALPERDLEAVVEYVKFLSLRWRRPEFHAPAVPIPSEPDWMKNSMTRKQHARNGRSLFLVACASCHGDDGQGNSAFLRRRADANEDPVVLPDLTEPVLRSGPTRRDIYRTLVTGLDGTPMPSFLDTLSAEQCWDLVAFLESVRKGRYPPDDPGL